MDKVPVRVHIHTRQTLEDGTSQKFTSQADGYLYQKENALYLLYQEQTEDEETVRTTWKIEPSQTTLIRQGASNLRIRFQQGSMDSTSLVTLYGPIPLEVETCMLEHNVTDTGGQLRVSYQMNVGGTLTRMDLEMVVGLKA